ncbi:MAG: glycosyltransferase family 4 protein [Clostridia bacterium]
MKIGIFTDGYNPTTSGVVTSVNMLEQEMRKRGHEVYIFAPSKSTAMPNEKQYLYMLHSMPLLVAKQYKNRIATFYSREVASKIKDLKLDIIHTQSEFSLGLFGKIISRKFDIPFVHTYHTMWEDYMHYIIPIKGTRNIYPKRFARTIIKNFVTKSECIITPSKKTEKYLKYRCKITNKPIFVIPTGIDIKPFEKSNFTKCDKDKLKESLGIEKDDQVILFLGRIGEEKSIDIIMNNMPTIFSKHTKVKFLIVGEGPSKSSLEEQAKKLNIQDKVIFTGKVIWSDVPKYYNLADVFVNASLTETQGLTFVEAMAAGLPIVARYAPNLSEFILHGQNGMLAKKDSDFSNYILSILDDNVLSKKLEDNGYITAKEYSVEKFGDRLELIYLEIIKNFNEKKKIKTIQERKEISEKLYQSTEEKMSKLD